MTQKERNKVIIRTSVTGVVVNVAIAAVKIVAGLLASSIAILSEGVNNAADALTSVLTLVGTKLAGRHPDAKHPFGYGRIEYLTGLVIAAIILVSGFQMLSEAVKLVFNPEPLAISYVSLGVVAVSAVVKFALALYTIARGKAASSEALVGVGLECGCVGLCSSAFACRFAADAEVIERHGTAGCQAGLQEKFKAIVA